MIYASSVAEIESVGSVINPPAGAPPLYPIADGYRRPDTLIRLDGPPKLVYLDLNHWVALAKAQAGHHEGSRHAEALTACEDAVERRAAMFPLSDAIYMEVSRIGSVRQRRELADVIERVSRFFVITARSLIADHEVEALLDRLVGPRPVRVNRMSYLDWGVARAFGIVGGFRFIDTESGADVTDRVRREHPLGPDGFDARMHEAELQLNRRTIEGPANPEEFADLRRRGYDPYAAYRSAQQRAAQENALASNLAAEPEWRRGRTRDVVAAHEIVVELRDKLDRGIAARHADGSAIYVDDPAVRLAFAEMPAFDVAVTMKASYHRDGTRSWTPNDIMDIDALGSTLPYCDVVVTDKAVAHHANRSGLAKRCGTTVISRLDDLLPYLN